MSTVPVSLNASSPWRTALPVLVGVLLAIGLLFRDTAWVMAGIWWRSETFAHCMLVLPISLWLVWRQRLRLAVLAPRPQPWLLLAMLPATAAWLLSEAVVVNAAAQFAFVTLLILAVPAVLGLDVARAILFPLLFLYFGVPFGEFMLPTMMEWTADFTVFALRATGIPVFREGQDFVIPSGNWSVIDECSGVRYVMASFLVGSLFAYLNYRSYRKRALFMLVALLLPVVANWFRAYMIVMLAHLSGNRLAVGVDHILYGWVFFGVIIFAMFMIGSRWSEPDEPQPVDGPVHGPVSPRWTRVLWGTALGTVGVAMLPHLALAMLQHGERAAAPVALRLPVQLAGGWVAGNGSLPGFKPVILNPSVEASQVYSNGAGSVGLHVAYFRGQSEDRKLVNSQHWLVAMRDEKWSLPTHGRRDLSLQGQDLTIRTAEIRGHNRGADRRDHLMVWRVYWIDGRFVAGDIQAKLVGALSRLRGRGDEGAMVLVYADRSDPPKSDALLGRFLNDNLSAINDLLARTRDAR